MSVPEEQVKNKLVPPPSLPIPEGMERNRYPQTELEAVDPNADQEPGQPPALTQEEQQKNERDFNRLITAVRQEIQRLGKGVLARTKIKIELLTKICDYLEKTYPEAHDRKNVSPSNLLNLQIKISALQSTLPELQPAHKHHKKLLDINAHYQGEISFSLSDALSYQRFSSYSDDLSPKKQPKSARIIRHFDTKTMLQVAKEFFIALRDRLQSKGEQADATVDNNARKYVFANNLANHLSDPKKTSKIHRLEDLLKLRAYDQDELNLIQVLKEHRNHNPFKKEDKRSSPDSYTKFDELFGIHAYGDIGVVNEAVETEHFVRSA